MKKYFASVVVIVAFVVSATDSGAIDPPIYYSTDLEFASQMARDECVKRGFDGSFVRNVIDSATFFVCHENEARILDCAARETVDIEGVPFLEMLYNPTVDICENMHDLQTLQAVEEKANIGDFGGRCDSSIHCDCRDNYNSNSKIYGSCGCAVVPQFGYGLYMDYSTCVDTPSCAVMKDVNGVNRAAYDSGNGICYVPKGYTFGAAGGNFEFSLNCYYSG